MSLAEKQENLKILIVSRESERKIEMLKEVLRWKKGGEGKRKHVLSGVNYNKHQARSKK